MNPFNSQNELLQNQYETIAQRHERKGADYIRSEKD
jgi:hypothetical protein